MTIDTAVLLVGGRGSRLYPLTATRPKPLIPFLNKPIVEYQIGALVRAGIKRIVFALNYFSEQFVAKAKEWEVEFGIEIIFSKENEVLGTGGPLKLAEKVITGDSFMCLNTDIYSNVDIKEMVKKFIEINATKTCNALIMTTNVKDPSKYGLITHENGKVEAFLEKPEKKENVEDYVSNTINAGIYVLSKKVFELIQLKETSLEREIFPGLALDNEMFIYEYDGIWGDIGVPSEYLKTQNKALKAGKASENVCVAKTTKIGSNVVLENCTIMENCVIEDDCVIKNALIGRECVVKKGMVIDKEEVIVIYDKTEVAKF